MPLVQREDGTAIDEVKAVETLRTLFGGFLDVNASSGVSYFSFSEILAG